MLRDKKAVIFDLDGTLVDSMWMWKDIDVEYLNRFQIPMPDDLQDLIEGMSFSETALFFREHFQLPVSIEEIKAEWNFMALEKYRSKVPLKPGVRMFLNYLKNQGIKMGIATSNSVQLLHEVLSAHKIEGYFDEIHTACEVEKGKPAPDIYLLVAKLLMVSPKDCLVFEDLPQGLLAGIRAGMQVCAVADDFSFDREEEKRKMADYFISSYEEIFFL